MSAPSGPARAQGDLERLGSFFAMLLKAGTYAKVTVSVQNGQLGLVHLDQSFKVQDLPGPPT